METHTILLKRRLSFLQFDLLSQFNCNQNSNKILWYWTSYCIAKTSMGGKRAENSGSQPGQFCLLSNIRQCPQTFLIVTTDGARKGDYYWHLAGKTQGCCYISYSTWGSITHTHTHTLPPTKNGLGQNVSIIKDEKLWLRLTKAILKRKWGDDFPYHK